MSYEDFTWVMDIDFWGVVHGCKAFLPHLLAGGQGRLINISSTFGLISAPTQSAYNAAKFAVRGLTESLRQELVDTGVRVTCVHPGSVRTNIVRNSRFRQGLKGSLDRTYWEDTFESLAHTSADKAAQIIIRGAGRGKKRILIGADARMMDWLGRLLPSRYEMVLRRLVEPKIKNAPP